MLSSLFITASLLAAQGNPQDSSRDGAGNPSSLDLGVRAALDSVKRDLAPTFDHIYLSPVVLPGADGDTSDASIAAVTDTGSPKRPKAIEYSDAYGTRLAIHRYASYATLPLFAAEFVVGRKLYNEGPNASRSLRGVHGALAGGLEALFAVNTVTGLWNLWDSRKDPNGRTRRVVHSLMMIVADAGFVATASNTPEHERRTGVIDLSGRTTHQTLAITSMGVALSSYLMMLIWKD